MQKIDCLDHGYVRLVDHLGDDLSVVNAARVSYQKESLSFNNRDEKLINFLWNSNPRHTSPMRHQAISFEVYAPLMIARQWWKYSVSSAHIENQNGWNESSRRYITEEPVFYIPNMTQWREKPANSKQGSGEMVDPRIGDIVSRELLDYIDQGVAHYEKAMAYGICAEQARLFLPSYGMYVRWRWMTSLEGVLHLLDQRLQHDSQYEFQVFAKAVKELTEPLFPATFKAVFGGNTL